MVIKRSLMERERIAGAVIFLSLFVILLSMLGIRLLDVKVSNIELVDRGLYTVVTDYGPVNVSKDDILRIERTYTKAAMTGAPVELDRIFTTKGFIYISSLDPFYKTGHQLINSVDFVGNPVWIRADNNNETTGSETTRIQLQNANLRAVQPVSFAIGTPSKLTSLVFAVLFIQYLALAIGGITLLILIFPLRVGKPTPTHPFAQQDPDYKSTEESVGAVAK